MKSSSRILLWFLILKLETNNKIDLKKYAIL